MVAALAGTIVPVLPGLTLILLVADGHGLLAGFGESGGKLLAAMAVLAIVSGAARLWPGKSAASRSGG